MRACVSAVPFWIRSARWTGYQGLSDRSRSGLREAIKNIEARTGRAAADEEIAGEIGIAAAELNEWQSQLKVTNVVSLNEFVEQGGEPVMDARGNSHFTHSRRTILRRKN